MSSLRLRPIRRAELAAAAIAILSAVVFAPAASAAVPAAFQVRVQGRGTPMILIPGLASAGSTWDGTVAHFQNQYRCYVLSLAGFAGVPPISAPLLPAVRDQLAVYIRAHHLRRPVIVGHSLGGFIALDLAARYPHLVGPVVIVDSLPFFAGAWFQVPNEAAAAPIIARMRAGMEGLTPAQWEAGARSGQSTNSMATSPADQQRLIQWSLESDRETVIHALLALVSRDLRPELPNIAAPVLVLGTWIDLQSNNVTRAAAVQVFQQQYAGLKHWKFAMSDNSRHFIMWDQPAWFYRQVSAFLSDPAAK